MSEIAKATTKKPETKSSNMVSKAQKSDFSQSISSPVDHILFLQRTIGNQAVQRLFESGHIQAKLRIGQSNDRYEQEADRVAEQVMRMPEPGVQRQVEPEEEEEEETLQTKLLANQITPLAQVQRQEEPEEEEETLQTKPLADQITPLVQRQEEPVQTKQSGGQTLQTGPRLTAQIHALRGGGQPLPQSTRSFFEPRFGYGFSQVRVHTDAMANRISKSINAKAFTTRKDVVFSAGQYSPETATGKRLLSHELAHVVQQNGHKVRAKLIIGQSSGKHNQVAEQVMRTPVRPWRRRKRSIRLSAEQRRACKGAKFLVDRLYSRYGLDTKRLYFPSSLSNWGKWYYKFSWRLDYAFVWKMIKMNKYSYMSTQKHLRRFKSTMISYERSLRYMRNIGHRSPQSHNKESELKRCGYRFHYYKSAYTRSAGRCTIKDPSNKVLFYMITTAQIDRAIDWLLRDAKIKGYSSKKTPSAATKIPFNYKQVLREAKIEYNKLSLKKKLAVFNNFKRPLALSKLIEFNWETNYGLGGIGKYEKKIVRSLWNSYKRGHKGWILMKYVWLSHMTECWKLAAYRWALRFATGKWSR